MLQAKLNSHRGHRLKKRLSVDSRVQEDLIIKMEMLELMEESHRRSSNTMWSINTSIGKKRKKYFSGTFFCDDRITHATLPCTLKQ
ncbi:hypothetical protein ATANTOWER_014359 [Ataeniobius toweri]|uniref:Uncharacterized protein n=1 Tax=Ataeniobius toweri TaxID=208326 RepID=A0ABU7CH20_9TELE|nr:hypothetical protein [Ataeniobius toweri]